MKKLIAVLAIISSSWALADSIDSVLTRYPQQSFDVQVMTLTPTTVEYTVRWNTLYLQELGRAAEASANETEMVIPRASAIPAIPANATMCYNNPNSVQNFLHCGTQSYIQIISGKNWDVYPYLFGWKAIVAFNDLTRVRRILEILVGTVPQVKLTATVAATGRPYQTCYMWPHLDHRVQYNVPDFFVDFNPELTQASVNGQMYIRGISTIPKGLTNINMRVVRQDQCNSL